MWLRFKSLDGKPVFGDMDRRRELMRRSAEMNGVTLDEPSLNRWAAVPFAKAAADPAGVTKNRRATPEELLERPGSDGHERRRLPGLTGSLRTGDSGPVRGAPTRCSRMSLRRRLAGTSIAVSRKRRLSASKAGRKKQCRCAVASPSTLRSATGGSASNPPSVPTRCACAT